ncbi:MAG: ribosome maturation factor RimM [Candidatus Aminicenantales bacterium]
MKKVDLVRIGKVLRSQGREGHLKVRLLEKGLPGPALSKVYLGGSGGFDEYEVESFELDRSSYFLKLKGIDSLVQSDGLAGLEIFVPEESFRPLEAGFFYDFQVIGSRVVTGDGTEVGTVRGILSAGGPDVLVVARGEKEYYVPFAEPICLRIDPEKREIVIDPPDGLLELNEI